MGIVRKIVNSVKMMNPHNRIKRVGVGILYSAIQLDSGDTGVAYSFPRRSCGPTLSGVGRPLSELSVKEIISCLGSENLSNSSVALAAINALISSEGVSPEAISCDVLQQLDIRDADTVCMIGCFLPILEKLKSLRVKVKACDLELKKGTLPSESAFKLLKQSTVALITATAIINNTIDPLLEASTNCREVVILGPSTPFLIKAFKDSPVSYLAGIRVTFPEEVFRVIGEGGGFRLFRPFTEKFVLRIV